MVVIFRLPRAYTGVCSKQYVPSYKNNIEKFKAKGIDFVICVAVNDPYTLNGWAEKLQAKEVIEFYGDFDGSFHKSLELYMDLSGALLGHRSHRWSAYIVDGKVQALNVEKKPSDFELSSVEKEVLSISGMEWLMVSEMNLIVYTHPSMSNKVWRTILTQLSYLLFTYDEVFEGVLLAYQVHV